jgi:hypothetical protein
VAAAARSAGSSTVWVSTTLAPLHHGVFSAVAFRVRGYGEISIANTSGSDIACHAATSFRASSNCAVVIFGSITPPSRCSGPLRPGLRASCRRDKPMTRSAG